MKTFLVVVLLTCVCTIVGLTGAAMFNVIFKEMDAGKFFVGSLYGSICSSLFLSIIVAHAIKDEF